MQREGKWSQSGTAQFGFRSAKIWHRFSSFSPWQERLELWKRPALKPEKYVPWNLCLDFTTTLPSLRISWIFWTYACSFPPRVSWHFEEGKPVSSFYHVIFACSTSKYQFLLFTKHQKRAKWGLERVKIKLFHVDAHTPEWLLPLC